MELYDDDKAHEAEPGTDKGPTPPTLREQVQALIDSEDPDGGHNPINDWWRDELRIALQETEE